MSKIASWFIQATVAIKYDKILQINEEVVADNTKKATKFSLAVFQVKFVWIFIDETGKNVFCLLMNIMSCGQFT